RCVGEDRGKLMLKGERMRGHNSTVPTQPPGSHGHLRTSANPDDLAAPLGQLPAEVTATAAPMQDPLARTGIEQLNHRRAQPGNVPGVLIVKLGIPLLAHPNGPPA